MAPATEVALLPLKAGADISDPNTGAGTILQEALNTVLDQDGAQRAYFGTAEEDPTMLWLFVDWDSYEAHQNFIKQTYYQPFVKNLLSILDGEIKMYHINFQPHPPSAALSDTNAPVTEVLTMFFPAGISSSDQEAYSQKLQTFPAPRGAVAGWQVEESFPYEKAEGGKAKVFTALLPWQSVKEHQDFRETQEFKDHISIIRQAPGLQGMNVVHVKCTELQRNIGGGAGIEERRGLTGAGIVQDEILNPQDASGTGEPKTTSGGMTTKNNPSGATNAEHKERSGRGNN